MLLIFKELTNIYEAIGVGLFPNLAADIVLKDTGESNTGGPRVAAQAIEHGILELARVLVIGDEGDSSSTLHVSSVKLARAYGATTRSEGSPAAHLTKLPLATVNICLVWPLKRTLTVVESIEKLTHIASLD